MTAATDRHTQYFAGWPCAIAASVAKGRHLIALRDFAQGETVLVSEAYLTAPRAVGASVPPDAENPVSWMVAFRVEKLPARAEPLVITYENQHGRQYSWHGSVYVEVGDCLDDMGSSMPDDPRDR